MIETKCSRIREVDIATLKISDLRKQYTGRVLAQGDPEYDVARRVFSGGIDRHPWLIIQAANTADVVRAVELACDTGLELAVRSGGHSSAGFGVTEGGIELDLRNMKGIEIDAGSQTAWVESGTTAGEFTRAAGAQGFAVPFGDTGTVGIGGLSTGGGIGYLVRKYGLAIDNLLAAEVVTADGSVLHADAETHPDLFWALRGGGGNFGVVTRFQFRLHEVDNVYGGMLMLPALAEVVQAFISEAQAAPEELSTIANILPAPPLPFIPPEFKGRLVLIGMMMYAGSPEKGEEVLKPFRNIAKPIADMVKPIHYPEIYQGETEMGPTVAAHTMFLDHVDLDTARTIVDHLQEYNAPMKAVQLRVLGGAMGRVDNDATAFAHRNSRILANLVAFYNDPAEKEARQLWVDEFAKSIHQNDDGAYVAFLGEANEKDARRAYPGDTWNKLQEIKRKYDPDNIFRLNFNIPPM